MSSMYSMRNMVLYRSGCHPIHPNQTRLLKEVIAHGLTWLIPCWTLLDYLRRHGAALLNTCHVLNRVLMKNKEKTPYKEWIGRKLSLSYLCTWGYLTKVNMPINKKGKLGPKTVDSSFWDMLIIALPICF
jgi:hypothetical protein